MPDEHSNVEDDADLYGQDAYDDDTERNRLSSEAEAERRDADEDDVVGHDEYVEDTYEEDRGTEYGGDVTEEDDDDSWWDEGLIGLLLVTGAILFFFPEPFTSTLGIVLLGLGAIAWVADALMDW